jgi:dimethylargininase
MLTAITRAVSPSLNCCELQHLERQEIDISKAAGQHRQYEACLRDLGVRVISLASEPDLPDSMFVEDPAVVVNEVAVMTRMGAPSRRGESASLAHALERFRPVHWMREPATLEGGDVLRIGPAFFAGVSARTNPEGISQLAAALEPFGYSVTPVAIRGCLHLKSAACPIGERTILANRAWFDAAPFEGYDIVDVPPGEPRAANVLSIGDTVIVPSCFPATARLLEGLGRHVLMLDISELMKAEAGLTCSSILFET